MIYSEKKDTLVEEMKKQIKKNTIIIGSKELESYYQNITYLSYGSIQNYDEISHNIFTLLRKADRLKPDLILIEGVKKEGLGIAIMNRLIRSCSYHYIEK